MSAGAPGGRAPDRTIEVAPERLAGWLDRFAAAHGALTCSATPERVDLRAADGAIASCAVPLPPLAPNPDAPYAGLLAHALAERVVAVLLVRRGGYAAGVLDGGRLLASKVGARHVQARTAAGGWSQQRFARRRDNQARQAFEAAAEVARRVWAPHAGRVEALVTGGDRPAVATVLAAVLADPGLAPLRALTPVEVPGLPDPRQQVLLDVPRRYRAVRVSVTDPVADPPA
ncbi:MAG: acVLRF1 family peptidyl-tRNA hydrolase [Frankiaceae bacterium]